MVNEDIRTQVFSRGITYRAIAKKMNVGAGYLSRIMRNPLSEKNKKRIQNAIEELEKQS